jgi:hypothetical protein
VRWCVSVCVSERERNLFPSVLLQPLGHLSVFRINRLQAVERLIIAQAVGVEVPSSIAFRFSGLRASVRTSPLELCQTVESCDRLQRFSVGAGLLRTIRAEATASRLSVPMAGRLFGSPAAVTSRVIRLIATASWAIVGGTSGTPAFAAPPRQIIPEPKA